MPVFATLIAPLAIVVLSVPLMLEWVPRNPIYGFRTPRTLSEDRVWYPANRVAGIALGCAGMIWLAAAYLIPRVVSPDQVKNWTIGVGLSALGAALLVSFASLALIDRR